MVWHFYRMLGVSQAMRRSAMPTMSGIIQNIRTILIEASVKLMKVGVMSWFPAASSAAASQIDSTVPVSTAKHSTHLRSAQGRPSMDIVSTHSEINSHKKHTSIQIVQLEKVPFLVHLI